MEIQLQETLGKIISRLGEGVTMKKLWTNPNPTSEFKAQPVNVNSSEYDKIEVVFLGATGAEIVYRATAEVGRKARAEMIVNPDSTATGYGAIREFEVTASSIIFGNTHIKQYTNNSTSYYNTFLIPYEIYGIKLNSNQRYLAPDYMEDYVVEQDTVTMPDGTIWEYTKRNSGYMELKGRRNGIISPNEFGSWGSYMKIAPITSRPFPFAFTELWDSNCHVWTVDGTSTMMTGDLYNAGQQPTNTMTGQFVVMRPTAPSGNINVRVSFEAFGTWK